MFYMRKIGVVILFPGNGGKLSGLIRDFYPKKKFKWVGFIDISHRMLQPSLSWTEGLCDNFFVSGDQSIESLYWRIDDNESFQGVFGSRRFLVFLTGLIYRHRFAWFQSPLIAMVWRS